jgi:hypothetical protein
LTPKFTQAALIPGATLIEKQRFLLRKLIALFSKLKKFRLKNFQPHIQRRAFQAGIIIKNSQRILYTMLSFTGTLLMGLAIGMKELKLEKTNGIKVIKFREMHKY